MVQIKQKRRDLGIHLILVMQVQNIIHLMMRGEGKIHSFFFIYIIVNVIVKSNIPILYVR